MKNFVYLLGSLDSVDTAVVDPAWDAEAITAQLTKDGRTLTHVLLTHEHHDHLNAVAELLRTHDVPVYAQRAEVDSPAIREFGQAVRAVSPGGEVRVGALSVKCVHTPGHTPGSQCFLAEGSLVSGDTVFVNACGRCDFSNSDVGQMYASIFDVLGKLPDETELLPGHDYGDVQRSTLGRERAQNPYFQLRSLEAFTAYRMRPR